MNKYTLNSFFYFKKSSFFKQKYQNFYFKRNMIQSKLISLNFISKLYSIEIVNQ